MKCIKKGSEISVMMVPITAMCNRQCPLCCARWHLTWFNKVIKKTEVSIDELRSVGKMIGHVDMVEITGGEPTMHSEFERLTNELPLIFSAKEFKIVTNGWLFKHDPSKLPLLLKYKQIFITHYTNRFAAKYGCSSNTDECEVMTKFLSEHACSYHVYTQDEHIKFRHHTPCEHAYDTMVAYYEGKIYGCCWAWSLQFQGKSIPLTEDWREHVNEIELPCTSCPTPSKINLCSGSHRIEGYQNVDVVQGADFQIDLARELLPFESDTLETLICMSAINYFTRERAIEIIRDIYRVLKCGGIVRFGVQDLRLFARTYLERNDDFYFSKLANGVDRYNGKTFADKFNNLFNGYLSGGSKCRYFYDFETLRDAFLEAGFMKIEQKQFGVSDIPEIKQIDNRGEQMFFLEAVK